MKSQSLLRDYLVRNPTLSRVDSKLASLFENVASESFLSEEEGWSSCTLAMLHLNYSVALGGTGQDMKKAILTKLGGGTNLSKIEADLDDFRKSRAEFKIMLSQGGPTRELADFCTSRVLDLLSRLFRRRLQTWVRPLSPSQFLVLDLWRRAPSLCFPTSSISSY